VSLHVRFERLAKKQLEDVPEADRRRIIARLEAYGADPDGIGHDVKPVAGLAGMLRLRVGKWRAIFSREETTVRVEKVAHRREAYR